VVRIHSGNGQHEEMDRRAIACFDQALEDVGLTAGPVRQVLHDYFAWSTTTTMARYHESADDVPESLRRWPRPGGRWIRPAGHPGDPDPLRRRALLEFRVTSRTLVDDLLAGHRRLGRLVNDLLILAAIDGRAPQRADPQRPVDLVGVVTDCSRRPVPDGISLRLGRLDRVFVRGDETQLSRVMSNLVDNALRYAVGMVELSVRQDGQWAVVSVSDDGPGIPESDRERIWERFARLDDDRSRASGGSGLGLAIVRELAAAHGGTVSVTSRRPGPGTTFLVRLPVTADRTR
jgi:signal transduction histidine kinase